MPEIDPLSSSLYFSAVQQQTAEQARIAAQKTRKDNKSVKTGKSRFAETLDRSIESYPLDPLDLPPEIAALPYDEALVALKDALDVAGDRLKASSATPDFAAYKESVTNFMKFVVRNNYQLESKKKYKNKRDSFILIKTVDEKLDQLAREVLLNHADKLRLLAKIDEVNGLLVDLMS